VTWPGDWRCRGDRATAKSPPCTERVTGGEAPQLEGRLWGRETQLHLEPAEPDVHHPTHGGARQVPVTCFPPGLTRPDPAWRPPGDKSLEFKASFLASCWIPASAGGRGGSSLALGDSEGDKDAWQGEGHLQRGHQGLRDSSPAGERAEDNTDRVQLGPEAAGDRVPPTR
jgi:hypothetical protein